MNSRTTILCMLLAAALLPNSAQADFVDAEVGARGLAMGGAFVAMSGDPAGLFWNPAAIMSDKRFQIEGMRTRLYDGIEGLNEDFVGVSYQLSPRAALGAGWTRTGLDDIYNEHVLDFAGAYELWEDRLVLGAALLFYGADAPGYVHLNDPNYEGADWKPSASLGAIYHYSEVLHFGASFENLLRPEIQLISTSTDIEQIGGRRRFGASYQLQEIVWITGEARHHDVPAYVGGDWTFHIGAESWFNEVLALRTGVDDGDFTAGAGLIVRKVRTDLALVTHERLGNSYRASITLGF